MTQSAKIGTAVAVGVALLLIAGVSIEGVRWMRPGGSGAANNATVTRAIPSNPQTSPDQDIPAGARPAAAEMRRLLAVCLDYSANHQDVWPRGMSELRALVSDQPINFDDYMYCYNGTKITDPQEAVLTQRNPRKEAAGQLIGFADGTVEWEPTFDWHFPSQRRATNVLLLSVYDSDWPDASRRDGIAFTFNDPADLPDTPRVVVGRRILMSGTCFQSSEMVTNPDGTAGIRILPASVLRDMLLGHTQENVNHRLAVVLEEEGEPHLLGAPLIRAATSDALVLPGPYKPEEAADLVARINIALKEQLDKYGPPKP
jgi:hypothetical protein